MAKSHFLSKQWRQIQGIFTPPQHLLLFVSNDIEYGSCIYGLLVLCLLRIVNFICLSMAGMQIHIAIAEISSHIS